MSRVSKLVQLVNQDNDRNTFSLESLNDQYTSEVLVPSNEITKDLEVLEEGQEDLDSLDRTSEILSEAQDTEVSPTTASLVAESLERLRAKYDLDCINYSKESYRKFTNRQLAREAEEASAGIWQRVKDGLIYIWEKIKSFFKGFYNFFLGLHKRIKATVKKAESKDVKLIKEIELNEEDYKEYVRNNPSTYEDTGVPFSVVGTKDIDEYFSNLAADPPGVKYLNENKKFIESLTNPRKSTYIEETSLIAFDSVGPQVVPFFKTINLQGKKVTLFVKGKFGIGLEVIPSIEKLEGNVPLLDKDLFKKALNVLKNYDTEIKYFKSDVEDFLKTDIKNILKVMEKNNFDPEKQEFLHKTMNEETNLKEFLFKIPTTYAKGMQLFYSIWVKSIMDVNTMVERSMAKHYS